MNNKRVKAKRKMNHKDMTRLMCLMLAGLMIFSVFSAVIAQVL